MKATNDFLASRTCSRDPIEAAAEVLWSKFTGEIEEETLVFAAEALEHEATAKMFLKAPEKMQKVLIRRYHEKAAGFTLSQSRGAVDQGS